MGSHPYRVAVEAVGAAARPAWLELVGRNPEVALSKRPDWVDCIRGCDRFTDASLLFRGDDGRRVLLPRLGVPGCPGLFASPPNHWNLGADASGFLTEGAPLAPPQTRALVLEVNRLAGLRTRVVVGRDDARAWQPAVPASVHAELRSSQVLDLDGGFATIWSERFTSKVRSNCRKAERRGVTVESDSTGALMPAFFALFRESVDRWARERGYPVPLMRWRFGRSHPRSKFVAVARLLGERCTVSIAWRAGQPLAGIVVLAGGAWATYWRGAMDKDLCRSSGANELLHRHAIEEACAQGRRSYDFGMSQTDALRRFKASFGAQPEPVHLYYFERVPTVAAETWCFGVVKQNIRRGVRLATGRR
jgi:hypothetical protein